MNEKQKENFPKIQTEIVLKGKPTKLLVFLNFNGMNIKEYIVKDKIDDFWEKIRFSFWLIQQIYFNFLNSNKVNEITLQMFEKIKIETKGIS